MAPSSSTAAPELNRAARQAIAEDTIATIKRGTYLTHDITQQVKFTNDNTKFFSADSTELSGWSTATLYKSERPSDISLLEISTLEGAKLLLDRVSGSAHPRVGILNFASAKNPGGGFLGGSRAQEESIARSSTLFPSLMTDTAQVYYKSHRRDPKSGLYSHAMIFSPSVFIIKSDHGDYIDPYEVDVVTSPAVNAGVARGSGKVEDAEIDAVMRERMSRILFLFERQGIRNIVLGSFGTGAFKNDVGMVARIWADLLLGEEAKFGQAFDNVVFAILGKETFQKFQEVFGERERGTDVT